MVEEARDAAAVGGIDGVLAVDTRRVEVEERREAALIILDAAALCLLGCYDLSEGEGEG